MYNWPVTRLPLSSERASRSDEPVEDLPADWPWSYRRARCAGDIVLAQHFWIEIDVDRERKMPSSWSYSMPNR